MSWTWRVEDPVPSAARGLLYEPGNWGDVLKGVWVVEVAGSLVDAGARPLRYADPFAGAPAYALVGGAGERLATAAGTRFEGLQSTFADRSVWASSARLVAEAAGPGGLEAIVFDADDDRREAWRSRAGVRVLDVADGWAALGEAALAGSDLVLVDPFDLDRPEHYKPALPRLAALVAGGAHLLLYFYDRSPRGPGHLKEARRFRTCLAEALGRPPDLAGRVPTDARAPRAWHEMILVRSPAARVALADDVVDRLAGATLDLGHAILDPALVDRPGVD